MQKELKKEKRVRRALLIAMLVTVLVTAASIFTIYTVRRIQKEDWKTAPGSITRRFYYSYNFKMQVDYSYYVSGTKYNGKEILVHKTTDAQQGDAVEIWYDPDNPEKSSFSKPDPHFNAAPILFPAAVVMVVLIIQFRIAEE